MKDPLFTGTCTALVTPFLNGQVNYPMMEQLLRRQLESGVRAIVIAGTTGESPTLSDAEKIEMFRRAKYYVGDRCQIIAGTGSNSTVHTIELSIAAQKVGADALLVVSPYYNKATPTGLVAHYTAVAEAVHLPIIIYNVPSRTGADIPVSVYKTLSSIPNICGIKEASTDISKALRIRAACGNALAVWSGNDEMTVPVMALGGHGVISVLSNVCPTETSAMTSAALAGDFETAASLQASLLPLTDALFCEVNPIPVKAAIKMIGFDCGECRLPLTSLTSDNYAKLKALLQ